MRIVQIKDEYIEILRKSFPIVLDNKRFHRKHTRKYIGIVFSINNFQYYAPFSSPKIKDYNNDGSIKKKQFVWYKNDLNEVEVDQVINIMDTKIKLKHRAYYGSRTGGSTIQLPFGFVQWHSPTKKIPGDMQFHHSYEDIMMAINEYTKAINLKENK